MTRTLRTFGIVTVGVLMFATILAIMTYPPKETKAEVDSRGCTISTSTSSLVGHQLSREILGTTSNRAWATIEQPANATNTIALAFSQGGAAAFTRGFTLTPATTTSPVPQISMGLNTPFSYTGSVQALSNTGSTTLLVTECRY